MFADTVGLKIYPFRTVQESTALPDKIWPVYIGSGNLAMSIDATGLQGANNIVQDYFGGSPEAADMYVVGHGLVGDTLNPNNTIPYGWFDYQISVDGDVFDTTRILREGSLFRRDNDILRATVTTSFLLSNRVIVEIKALAPLGSHCVMFAFRVCSYSQQNPNPADTYKVALSVNLHFTTRRKDKPIFDIKHTAPECLELRVQGHEAYKTAVSFAATEGKTFYENHTLTQTVQCTAGVEFCSPKTFAYAFDGALADGGNAERVSAAAWKKYYAESADIQTGDNREEYLFHNSLYLLRLGYNPRLGYPIGHPFDFPGCWNQCMFWDMHFVAEGLLRTNRVKEAREILKLLHKTLRHTGKPFPWMFIYDGTTFLQDERDIAPVVIAAHAMTAVKYYEITRDEKDFEDYVFPIVSRCADFAARELFTRDKDGSWIVSRAVSNDVVDEEGDEINQTYTALWFLVILKKAAEYCKKSGKTADARWAQILSGYRLEHTDGEYLHCKGHSAAEYRWASWIPFLAYPTEGHPFLDRELLSRTREKYSYTELYQQKQNSYQPWMECTEAQAAHRTGETERAYALVRQAMTHVHGDGYFSEIGPKRQTCGFPPYITAHGEYLSVWADTFVSSPIWENKIEIGCNLPQSLLLRFVRAVNLRAANGISVSAVEYSPSGMSCILNGIKAKMSAVIRLPAESGQNDVRVFVNGAAAQAKIDIRRRTAAVELEPSDVCEIVIG